MGARLTGRLVVLVLFLGAVSSFWFLRLDAHLTFAEVKEKRLMLRTLVDKNYFVAVIVYIAAAFSTAFFIPGAIIITLAGGFFFGVIKGTVFVIFGMTAGATAAFIFSRYLIGQSIQERYGILLRTFNEEMARHGAYYLAALRVVPVLPAFILNFIAGMTRISLRTFASSTALGMVPGALVYTFAGRQMGSINEVEDILSPEIMLAFLLLALFALLPVFVSKLRRGKRH
jgi:uncharacterized membrane protein YdjX (TVP38/TMEM64 family)